MPKSAITVSFVPEAKGGPFVFWNDLEHACKESARIGFDAIEIFAPDGETIRSLPIDGMLSRYELQIAAFGTGAGMVKHGLSLSEADYSRRQRAQQFVRSIIEASSTWRAPIIIGSMQGKWTADCNRENTLANLRESLVSLGKVASDLGIEILLEPLNRYESNLLNTLSDGKALLDAVGLDNVKLLLDLFHANIEEANIEESIGEAMPNIGHIHLADSNRRAAGFGHLDLASVARAISAGGYNGCLSAEVFPLPDSIAAAEMTMVTFKKLFAYT